jgi:hypothetical protein
VDRHAAAGSPFSVMKIGMASHSDCTCRARNTKPGIEEVPDGLHLRM